jgi:hypothetical protein
LCKNTKRLLCAPAPAYGVPLLSARSHTCAAARTRRDVRLMYFAAFCTRNPRPGAHLSTLPPDVIVFKRWHTRPPHVPLRVLLSPVVLPMICSPQTVTHPHQKHVEPRGDNDHTLPKRVAHTAMTAPFLSAWLTLHWCLTQSAHEIRAHIAVATSALINVQFGRHALDVNKQTNVKHTLTTSRTMQSFQDRHLSR